MARASCKAPMELLQQQVAESTFCLLASRYSYWQAVKYMQQRARQPRNMARVSCKAPMELLQQQVAGSPFCNRSEDIQTGMLCHVCSKELGCPEIWPKPAARLQLLQQQVAGSPCCDWPADISLLWPYLCASQHAAAYI